jgi:hypothetical protein
MYASCAGPRIPHVRFSWVVPIRGNLSHWPNRVVWTLLLLRKRAPDTIPSTSVDRSIDLPPNFSPLTAIEAVMKVKHLLMNRIHQFTGPISPACDQYIQYLLTGVNPLVLNRHRQGLQPWRCRFSLSLSPPFPTDGPSLSPNGPTRS